MYSRISWHNSDAVGLRLYALHSLLCFVPAEAASTAHHASPAAAARRLVCFSSRSFQTSAGAIFITLRHCPAKLPTSMPAVSQHWLAVQATASLPCQSLNLQPSEGNPFALRARSSKFCNMACASSGQFLQLPKIWTSVKGVSRWHVDVYRRAFRPHGNRSLAVFSRVSLAHLWCGASAESQRSFICESAMCHGALADPPRGAVPAVARGLLPRHPVRTAPRHHPLRRCQVRICHVAHCGPVQLVTRIVANAVFVAPNSVTFPLDTALLCSLRIWNVSTAQGT